MGHGSARLEALLIDCWRFCDLPLIESFGYSGALLHQIGLSILANLAAFPKHDLLKRFL